MKATERNTNVLQSCGRTSKYSRSHRLLLLLRIIIVEINIVQYYQTNKNCPMAIVKSRATSYFLEIYLNLFPQNQQLKYVSSLHSST